MKQLSRFVFFILIAELIIGGGGRLISFGPISLRMILFAFAISISVIYFVRGRRISKELTIFLTLFVSCLGVALLLGIASGAHAQFWIEDIKPLAYVLILPFFYFVLEDHYITRTVSDMIIMGGLFLSAVFFTLLLLIHTNILPFLPFYHSVVDTGEFFFRAETTFFYKGFIYLCIALIFVIALKPKCRLVFASLLGLAILLTFTRGFIFALGLTAAFYCLYEKKYATLFLSIAITAGVLFFSKPIIYTTSSGIHELKGMNEHVPKEKLLGNRDESDTGRIQQAREVISEVTPLSFMIGHGFGIGVPSRPVHMEVSYLEIFHKQGIVGLGLWAFLFYLLSINYLGSSKDKFAKAFYFSASFLFFQSITNQFINNPIGLSFALLSLTYLHQEKVMLLPTKRQRKFPRHQKGDEISATSF